MKYMKILLKFKKRSKNKFKVKVLFLSFLMHATKIAIKTHWFGI